jgi:L-aminopeptidase/D-esterase-like protein
MALAGFARAIRPVFAPTDGDVLFCLSTGEVQAAGPRPMLLARLGELGAACVARAIARGVWAAR